MPEIEPTDDERRNGWTAETLAEYLASRQAALDVDPNSPQRRHRPEVQNHAYNPHRWRG